MMIELSLSILDRITPVALTALLQTMLMLGLACIAARLLRRRHAICHAVCFGAILSCLACPMLAYGVFSSDSTSLWLVQIADAVDGHGHDGRASLGLRG